MADKEINPFDEPEDNTPKASETIQDPDYNTPHSAVIEEFQVLEVNEAPTRVSVTLKAGKTSDAPWIVVEGPTVKAVLDAFLTRGPDTEKLIAEASGAAAAFQKAYSAYEDGIPAPRTVGRPKAADGPTRGPESASPEPPVKKGSFKGKPKSEETEAPPVARVCKHKKQMDLVEAKGKKGFVCVAKPKGDPDRCPPIFV